MKTTIAISIETRSRLNKLGKKDDSYDSIITRLLDARKENDVKRRKPSIVSRFFKGIR